MFADVLRRDVVRRHAAARAEVAEVERRPVDRAAAAARPLDLGDLLAAALGRLGERLGLQDAVADAAVRPGERRVRERAAPLMWNVLLVEPWTPGQAPVARVNQPAPVFGGAWVSRPLPDAYAPLRSSSRKPGVSPSSAYFSTRSCRRPSEAKNSSLPAVAAVMAVVPSGLRLRADPRHGQPAASAAAAIAPTTRVRRRPCASSTLHSIQPS